MVRVHAVGALALLAVAAVCLLSGVQNNRPVELEEASVRDRVAKLETQAKEIEDVRQDATFLNHQIAELEKQGESGKFDEKELKSKATELRNRLLGLAKESNITPSRLLTRYQQQQHLASNPQPAKRAMPPHRSIDDPMFVGADVHKATRAAGQEAIGVLAEADNTAHDQGHYLHRFGGLGDNKQAWEVAPKLNQWGEEAYTPKHYLMRYGGRRSSQPTWLYAPNESINGADKTPSSSGKAQPADTRRYLNRYGGHTTETPTWAVMPEVKQPAWKVGPVHEDTTGAYKTPAQQEAAKWFSDLQESKHAETKAREASVDAQRRDGFGAESREVMGAYGSHEQPLSEFQAALDGKVAKEMNLLRAADRAVQASSSMSSSSSSKSSSVHNPLAAAAGGESGPLARASSYLSGLVSSASSKYAQAVQKQPPSVYDEAEALDAALEASAQQHRQQRISPAVKAAHAATQRESAAWATVKGMERDLAGVERKEEGMSRVEKQRLQPELRAMRGALDAARETAASEMHSAMQVRKMHAAELHAAHLQTELAGRKRKQELQLTAKAVRAENHVREVEAALAAAKAKASKQRHWAAMSKLDKLGVRTGEIQTQWGGDQIV